MNKSKKPTGSNNQEEVKRKDSTGTFSIWLIAALVLALIVFGQTIGFDFVNWDDDVNVLENRGVTQFDLKYIWTETVIGNYNPLPITSFAFEYLFVGENASLYHINNLLLHLINIVLVFFLGRRLKLSSTAAGILALLFAIHPMRVESVAWVTERKDVLFSSFYFGALLMYENMRSKGKAKSWSWGIGLLFILALFSKIQAVSLPLSMLACDYLREKDFKLKQEIINKIPYFVLSLAIGLLGIYFLGRDGSLEDATNYTFFDKLAVGSYSYTVYLIKSIIPYEMSPLYPYPSNLPWHVYAAFATTLPVIAFTGYSYIKNWKALTFGLAFFTVNVMFMLQILSAGQGFIADRFTYVGYFGLFWMMAYGIDLLLKSKTISENVIKGIAIAYLLILSIVSYSQTKIWKNGGTLWSHVSSLYPNTSTAYGNEALYERDKGNTQKAMVLFNKAINASPKKHNYYSSRGKLKFDQGQVYEAIKDYSKGLEFKPDGSELLINRGAAYASQKKYKLAEKDLNAGLGFDKENFNGYLNRSLLYYTIGKTDLALMDYDKMLKMRPERHDLWQEYSSILHSKNQTQKAINAINEAIKRAPNRKVALKYKNMLKSYR